MRKRKEPLSQLQSMRLAAEEGGRCFDGRFGCATLEEAEELAVPEMWSGSGRLSSQAFASARKAAREASIPVDLPKHLQAVISPMVRSGAIDAPPAALPLSKKRLQAAAPSTKQTALHDWLDSEEGRLWRKERDMMFQS